MLLLSQATDVVHSLSLQSLRHTCDCLLHISLIELCCHGDRGEGQVFDVSRFETVANRAPLGAPLPVDFHARLLAQPLQVSPSHTGQDECPRLRLGSARCFHGPS